jgi:hypothetical protein
LSGSETHQLRNPRTCRRRALEVPPGSLGEVVVLLNVANWTDSNPPKLEVHEPELTDTTVALGTDGAGEP